MDEQDMQVFVQDILAGISAMGENIKQETRALLEAQDKKINLIAEKVLSLDQRMSNVEERLDTIESDVKVIKSVVTIHSEDINTLKAVN